MKDFMEWLCDPSRRWIGDTLVSVSAACLFVAWLLLFLIAVVAESFLWALVILLSPILIGWAVAYLAYRAE